ncbi:15496_t:CDS:2, partial [Racocetra fulgida]
KESPEKRQKRLSNDQHRRLKKKVAETTEEHEAHLVCDREKKQYKAEANTNLQQESERPVIVNIEGVYQDNENTATTFQSESNENTRVNINLQQESERPIIGVNIETIYPVSENISSTSQSEDSAEISVELQSATTLSDYEKELLKKFRTKMSERTLPKKFFSENNIDPDEIPEKLQE